GARLRELLSLVPSVSLGRVRAEVAPIAGWRPDLSIEVRADGESWMIIGEVKSEGQPRHIRGAALQVKDYVQRLSSVDPGTRAYGVVLAPYISPASAQICTEAGVGFAD